MILKMKFNFKFNYICHYGKPLLWAWSARFRIKNTMLHLVFCVRVPALLWFFQKNRAGFRCSFLAACSIFFLFNFKDYVIFEIECPIALHMKSNFFAFCEARPVKGPDFTFSIYYWHFCISDRKDFCGFCIVCISYSLD